MTEQNMINAYGGESQAHARYMHFAHQADREKLPNVGRLFRAVAAAELIHASDHYFELRHLDGGFVANSMAAFGPGDTKKNLGLAIAGESFEINEMYPAYIHVAKLQGEKTAERSFEWSCRTEMMHKELFEKAKKAVDAGGDADFGPIQVCEICGCTLEGAAPEKCPICKAAGHRFKTYK